MILLENQWQMVMTASYMLMNDSRKWQGVNTIVKKIMILTGSRGEWGYIRPIMELAKKKDDVKIVLVVTNMHLLSSYGNSYKEIENDGYKIDYKINMSLDGYNHVTHAKSLGICLMGIPDIIDVEKPDWILLAGDRGNSLWEPLPQGIRIRP